MTNVVIASAARTAVGSFAGAFSNTPAHDLGAAVLQAVVERAGVDKGEVSETILGQVLTAAQGQNPARHISTRACPRKAPPGASTRSADRAFGRWRWARSTSCWATPPSSAPADRRT
jgi:acetyl-CoA acetyltransferase